MWCRSVARLKRELGFCRCLGHWMIGHWMMEDYSGGRVEVQSNYS